MNINKAYYSSLMTKFSYGNYEGVYFGDSLKLKIEDTVSDLELTDAALDDFVSKYKVVHQYTNESSGFSATLFQETSGNQEYYLAFRGSDSFGITSPDWYSANSDHGRYGILLRQAVDIAGYIYGCAVSFIKKYSTNSFFGVAYG